MINQKDILQTTHFGLSIYKRVLSYYYEDSLALGFSGKKCIPTKNPFNENKETLLVTHCFTDGFPIDRDRQVRAVPGNEGKGVEMFCYQDTELPGFKGDAFDFAALHYQLSGDKLLEKINRDLHLHLDQEKEAQDQQIQAKAFTPVYVIEMPGFSFYHSPITNTRPNKLVMTLLEVYHLIKGDTYKDRTLKLRSIADPEAASQFKRTEFDCVTFSGVFSKRSNTALVNHSGLLTLDFDHVENLAQKKEDLLDDPKSDLLIDLLFDSPSGHGFKSIISIDVMRYSHQQWFETVSRFLKKRYNLEVDRSGKDVARACFLPHDPNVWIHPLYLV